MPSFDGENLIITLDSGVTDVDVIDGIYEPWKNWMLSSPVNRKYPQAFRSDGGAPLSAIINQGSYIFLNNVAGWRIKPPEEDITVYLTGNLAVEDTALPAFVPTIGAFTAAILGLQPVTQGVTPVMGQQLEFASFVNGVWVDQAFGTAGTGYTAGGLPIGNPQTPVNNIPDAVAIVAARGLPRTIYVIGDLTLDTGDDVSSFKIIGQNAARSSITINAGAQTLECDIEEAYVTGNLDGGAILRNCSVQNLNYINGFVYNCLMEPGTIALGGTATAHFMDCKSGEPGPTTPIIDCDGTGGENTPLAFRGYDGGLKLVQKTGNAPVSIDLAAGQVIIASTCVAGTVVVRGDGKVVDEAGNDLHSGVINGGLTLINEASNGSHIHEVWQRLGLDPNAPLRNKSDGGLEVGDITVTATPSGSDIIQTRT